MIIHYMKTNLLKKLNKNEMYSLYSILYKTDDDTIDIWVNRSEPLLSLALEIKDYYKFDEDKIKEILNFDYLISLYGGQLENKELQSAINNYFLYLPGFSLYAEKQCETTYEMHGYLQMQLIKFFHDLEVLSADEIIYKRVYFSDIEKKELFIQEINAYFPEYENYDEIINNFLEINKDLTNYDLVSNLITHKSKKLKNYMISVLGYTHNPLVNQHNEFLLTLKNKIEIIDCSRKLNKELTNKQIDEKLIKI